MPTDAPDDLNIVLLSDSTGDTVTAAMRAAASQFALSDARYQIYSFIRKEAEVAAIPEAVFRAAAIVAYTSVNPALKRAIEARCQAAGTPAVSLLDPLIEGLSMVLGETPSSRPGQQYLVNNQYLDRVRAIDFAMALDDGQTPAHALSADVILTGVSRTSKTPTCIYLGYQGIRAANIPLTPNAPAPPAIGQAVSAGVPVIGLVASAERLLQVRKTRLLAIGGKDDEVYTDRTRIEEELVAARLLFDRLGLPVIDVTRRSIEETAAAIRGHLRDLAP